MSQAASSSGVGMRANYEPPSLEWTCPCLNIRLAVEQRSQCESEATGKAWLAILSSDDAITVKYPLLTSRETITLEESGTNAVCARCLNCDTIVYAASKPAPAGPNRAVGFNTFTNASTADVKDNPQSPSRDVALASRTEPLRPSEPLVRPLDRRIWLLPGALSPEQAIHAASGAAFSPSFGILVARQTQEDGKQQHAAASGFETRRETTPTRPGPTGVRQPSFGSGSSGRSYALPPIPQHLITTPPQSPRVSASTTPSSTTNAPALSSSVTQHPLAAQLDSVALERLKELRSKAEAEVFELLRQKRRDMELLEQRMKQDAEVLLNLAKHPKTNGNIVTAASMIGQAMKDKQQKDAKPKLEPVAGQSSGTPIAASSSAPLKYQASAGLSSRLNTRSKQSSTKEGATDAYSDLDSDLPPSAFERRPTYVHNPSESTLDGPNSFAPSTATASLGGLSASFAMRGRELPTQLQNWAEKRRLRERYPQGDHSALPSAANSNATSAANSSATSEDEESPQLGKSRSHRGRERELDAEEESEMAQRGRSRGNSNARELSELQANTNQKDQRSINSTKVAVVPDVIAAAPEPEGRGRKEATRGRTGRPVSSAHNPPAALSSSVLTKKPALAFVDDGRNADENTPTVGDRLVSPQSVFEPSAQVTLRPRDPPPSNAAPLKPATRALGGSSDTGDGKKDTSNETRSTSSASKGDSSSRSKPSRATEKKVAFAETEDRVDHASVDFDELDTIAQETALRADAASQRIERRLVDEAADAVFEIDEDGDAVLEDEQVEALSPAESDRHRIEMSQTGLRTGESGRPRGQADDSLPGSEDELEDNPRSAKRLATSGSLSDDLQSASEDEDKVPAGFGAASFSALAAGHTNMRAPDASGTEAHVDDAGFDPASLRFDGRIVPASGQIRDQDLESEPFVVGSLRNSVRRTSVQLPAAALRAKGDDINRVNVDGAISASNSSRQPRSSSRSRIAHMSKEDAETEVRLSGLLAPNAPSHRSLWSPKDAKTLKAAKNKYRLNEEDDEKWDAWKRKTTASTVSSRETIPVLTPPQTNDGGSIRSVPVAVAPPVKYISAASGIGPRPLRESTMVDPDYANSIAVITGFDKSIAAGANPGLNAPRRKWGYGSFKDDTSGFETEPKTSLPYKEKMMVPSLRKAIRRSKSDANEQLQHKAKLETIPDADDASVSNNAASISTAKAPTQMQSKTPKAELPGSLVTRGFAASDASGGSAQSSALPKSTVTQPAEKMIPRIAPSTMSEATESADRDPKEPSTIASTPSRTGTPNSLGRRSPRPPYVPPPPPTSYSTVLPEDPNQRPQALQLFAVPADPCFQLTEDEAREEVEETEEGWEKTLKFMHVIEQLKINKRTGWLHHRVPQPESIADHQYRMALLSILCPPGSGLDLGKCVQLAVVHDLAEAEVGDLTPLDGVSKDEKVRREKEAIQYFVHDLLGSSSAGLRIEALWEEYEARETNEAKLVKDLDRFELCLQAIEYERRYGINDLQPFFEGSAPYITHPTVRKWATVLAKERSTLWKNTIITKPNIATAADTTSP